MGGFSDFAVLGFRVRGLGGSLKGVYTGFWGLTVLEVRALAAKGFGGLGAEIYGVFGVLGGGSGLGFQKV